jgi:hypothetical protein
VIDEGREGGTRESGSGSGSVWISGISWGGRIMISRIGWSAGQFRVSSLHSLEHAGKPLDIMAIVVRVMHGR